MQVTDGPDLYAVALERFVSERTALAKALRGEGRREEARRVAGLRKPSVAAWAVNQLARTQRASMADLFAAGDELSRAHAELLAGRGDPGALRAATARERDAVNRLAEVAQGLLSQEGHELSAATLERVSETLHAAARDTRARELVRAGCLERELHLVGLGSEASVRTAASRQPGPVAPQIEGEGEGEGEGGGEQAEREQAEREQAEREQAEREQAEREQAERLTAARRAESQARDRADQAARALSTARERRERAAQALRAADAALARAQAEADAATSGHRCAQRALHQVVSPPAAAPG